MTQAAEPPQPMSDERLAGAGRVVLAITVERVTAAGYIPAAPGPAPGRAPKRTFWTVTGGLFTLGYGHLIACSRTVGPSRPAIDRFPFGTPQGGKDGTL
jgi:hypothetical protein